MKKKYELGKRKYVMASIACVIIFTYILRLFSLQLLSEDYKQNADSNAFLKHILFPARGAITDRNGKLLASWAQELLDKKMWAVNMLGCHDGIPMLDLKGMLEDDQKNYKEAVADGSAMAVIKKYFVA